MEFLKRFKLTLGKVGKRKPKPATKNKMANLSPHIAVMT